MENSSFRLYNGKVIIRLRDHVADTSEHLLSSRLFRRILIDYIEKLYVQKSKLLKIFDNDEITERDADLLIESMLILTKLPVDLLPRVVMGADQFVADKALFYDFIEGLYNYWRSLHRLIICDSVGERFDKRPYRTFNNTVETLMHVVRSTYRDIQENVTGNHPRVYRQVSAGAEIGAIALPREIPYTGEAYQKLNDISIIRQVLIYPPMIFNSPMNTRTGVFERVYTNPLEKVDINQEDWICYPAKIGELVVMVYFSIRFFELGFAMSNLFELASDEDLRRKPDAVFLFGTPNHPLPGTDSETIFFDDDENTILTATIPCKDEYGYFGYLKKMMLTLHNIKMMKMGRLPFHGALFNMNVRDKGNVTVLIIGDSGAGKSESLEALRVIAKEEIEDMTIIADDMGSIEIDKKGNIIGYGTEIGAFVRLDDLQPGYAFGQIDRTIIMNPNKVNARVVLPITKYEEVVKGYPIDMVLYANNYDVVDDSHPTLAPFANADEALSVFRQGAVMSKGTTTTKGLVNSYFANIFGPPQYRHLHEQIAERYFDQFFKQGLYVGQFRTQLGVVGWEQKGPENAAIQLLETIKAFSAEK
jgi:energy-coupling factor transporter ATP-binding protein EcfA2